MWVAAAEADGTRRTMVFLISCLVGIAVLLTGLTIWYWLMTRPDDDDESGNDDDVAGDPPRPQADSEQPREPQLVDHAAAGIGHFDFTTVPDGDPVAAPGFTPEQQDAPAREPVRLDLTDPEPLVDQHPAPPEPPSPVAEPSLAAAPADTDPDIDQVDLVAAERELVAETEDGGQELTDDGWDAIRRSVFDKFQR